MANLRKGNEGVKLLVKARTVYLEPVHAIHNALVEICWLSEDG